MLKLRVTAYDPETERVYCRCERTSTLFCVSAELDALRLYECTDSGEPVCAVGLKDCEINGSAISREDLAKFKTVKDFATAFSIGAV